MGSVKHSRVKVVNTALIYNANIFHLLEQTEKRLREGTEIHKSILCEYGHFQAEQIQIIIKISKDTHSMHTQTKQIVNSTFVWDKAENARHTLCCERGKDFLPIY